MNAADFACAVGCIVRTFAESAVATLPGARVGDGVVIRTRERSLSGEIVAVERGRVTIVPFDSLAGVAVGDRVEAADAALACPAPVAALGRILDAAGRALDGRPAPRCVPLPSARSAASPHARVAIDRPFATGVRAIDGLLTLGRGARIGIFGAPGAGKTTLLERIARTASADAVVLALIGERGREAQRWFARVNARTTILCATSDCSASERIRAGELALAQAERLRDCGLHVVVIFDSLARYAAALRERGVALGEPVGRGGFPPSVWSAVARLVERAGATARGSITLLATVLSDGPGDRDPVSDGARSLLDGHVVLSADLARANRYPAIDVLASASRTMADVVDDAHARDAERVRTALALLERTRDARDVGLADLDDPALRRALACEPLLEAFLYERELTEFAATRAALRALATALIAA